MALWILHGACPERTRSASEGGVEGFRMKNEEEVPPERDLGYLACEFMRSPSINSGLTP